MQRARDTTQPHSYIPSWILAAYYWSFCRARAGRIRLGFPGTEAGQLIIHSDMLAVKPSTVPRPWLQTET